MNRKRLVVVLDTKVPCHAICTHTSTGWIGFEVKPSKSKQVHIFDLSNVQLLQTMDTVCCRR